MTEAMQDAMFGEDKPDYEYASSRVTEPVLLYRVRQHQEISAQSANDSARKRKKALALLDEARKDDRKSWEYEQSASYLADLHEKRFGKDGESQV